MNRPAIGFDPVRYCQRRAWRRSGAFFTRIPQSPRRRDPVQHAGPGDDRGVVDKLLVEVETQLEQKGVSLTVDDDARTWIARKGSRPRWGPGRWHA